MTRVSSGRPKKGPPAHANTYAFHHNKSSKLTQHILSLPINNLCPACTDIIEWRKKFRKYKPLTVMKKCTRCGGKKIKDAYHVVCDGCARESRVCAKCLEGRDRDEEKKKLLAMKEAENSKKSGDQEEQEDEEESSEQEESEQVDDDDEESENDQEFEDEEFESDNESVESVEEYSESE